MTFCFCFVVVIAYSGLVITGFRLPLFYLVGLTGPGLFDLLVLLRRVRVIAVANIMAGCIAIIVSARDAYIALRAKHLRITIVAGEAVA